MSETKNKFESIREWIVEHKLRTVGNKEEEKREILSGKGYCSLLYLFHYMKILFLGTSEEYSWQLRNSLAISRPLTRESLYSAQECMLHAQALTLAALAGAAVVEYYDHKSGAKAERVAKGGFLVHQRLVANL
ncbi:hypothetical protein M9H77_36817 [Catharanthus roseus]|uniref:Uncharacterized protein n=1 Tax=Catharanthus roseus TaxID=4058 RepID=A0ACB9ZSW0_CATRO|nr:hypothetical protein M9H77_36817 [Catharanthus roseus]